MSKFIKWLETWLPGVWSVLLAATMTGLLLGSTISVIRWVVNLLGVM